MGPATKAAAPPGRTGADPNVPNQAVHVTGLPESATWEAVHRLMRMRGIPKRIIIYWHEHSGPGHMVEAVVTFAKKGSVAAAVAGFSALGERDRCASKAGFAAGTGAALTVEPSSFAAQKLEETAAGDLTFPKTAFVSGLPTKATGPYLRGLFGRYGRIRRIGIYWDEPPGVRGGTFYAFVTFAKPGSVTDAMRQLNGTHPPGGPRSVLTVEPALLKRGRFLWCSPI